MKIRESFEMWCSEGKTGSWVDKAQRLLTDVSDGGKLDHSCINPQDMAWIMLMDHLEILSEEGGNRSLKR